MKSKINILLTTVIMSFIVVATVPFVPAAKAAADPCATSVFFPHWYDGYCTMGPYGPQIKSPNSMSASTEGTQMNIGQWVMGIALNIVQMILYAVGYISIGYIIYGGFKFMINGDSSSGTASARKTIQNAVIGLVISIMSVAIVKFVAGIIN